MHSLSCKIFKIIPVISCLSLLTVNVTMASTALTKQQQENIDSISIPFIENVGQLNQSNVAYYARTFGGTLFVTKNGEWIYNLPKKSEKNSEITQSWSFSERLLNSDAVDLTANEISTTKINSFKGSKKSWRSDINAYQSISLNEIYPGINLTFNASSNNIEKIFTIAPKANPAKIKIEIEGVNKISTSADNQLVLTTDIGDITFTKPIAYQLIDGEKSYVDVAYLVHNNYYGFELGQYDTSQELIIDPLLASTFIGSDANIEQISSMKFDGGYVFVAGSTTSSNFPAYLGYDDTHNGGIYDGFIAKFSADLSTLLVSTFFGGDGADLVTSLTVDELGNVYILGTTASDNFPLLAGSYQYDSAISRGTYIAKFNNDLNSLLATAIPLARGLNRQIRTANNSVYIAGLINSPTLPVSSDAYVTTCGRDGLCNRSFGGDGAVSTEYFGYVERLSTDLTSLLSATYLNARGGSFAVASNTNVYVIENSRENAQFISLSSDLTTLLGSVSYPNNNNIAFANIAVSDTAVIASGRITSSSTNDPMLPTTINAYDSTCGTDGVCNTGITPSNLTADIFIGKYSFDLLTTDALTYFGGSNSEFTSTLEIDDENNIVIAGYVLSTDLPTTSNAFSTEISSTFDAFVSKFNADLSELIYSSYIGGSGLDRAFAVSTGPSGAVYIAGETRSTDFPVTSGAYDTTYNGGNVDAFVSLFDTSGTASDTGGDTGTGTTNEAPVADAGSDQTVVQQSTVYLDGSQSRDPEGSQLSFQWQQVSGKSISLKKSNKAVVKFRAPKLKRGTTSITLIFELTVTDDQGASSSDQITIVVQ